MRLALLCAVILSFAQISAQDKTYVHRQAEILAGPEMYGRGYVKDGVGIAADYILSEFKKHGLQAIRGSYKQAFSHPVNVFDGKMKVCIDGRDLVPGREFIVSPDSKGGKMKFKYELIDMDVEDPNIQHNAVLNKGMVPAYRLVEDIMLEDLNGELSESQIKAKKMAKRARELWLQKKSQSSRTIIETDGKLTWGGSMRESENFTLKVGRGLLKKSKGKVKMEIDQRLVPDHLSENVFGMVKGTLYPDSFIVFTAHYDQLGMMGEHTYFPGANDNASGTAVMMSLAKHYAAHPQECSILFIAFAAEEIGLVGSRYFVEHPVIPLEHIGFLINIDLFASGSEGITVVNATEVPAAFDLLQSINEEKRLLPLVKKRGKAYNSDHAPFVDHGVPAVFIYAMGGSDGYHDINDTADRLDFAEYPDFFLLLTTFVERLNQ